jgi:hypothetical protein
MPGKSKLLTVLTSIGALAAGIAANGSDKAFAQACADIAASNDVGMLQAIAADSANACQQLALQRLVELAPAAGPVLPYQEATPAPTIGGLSPPGRADASGGNEGQESNSATDSDLY